MWYRMRGGHSRTTTYLQAGSAGYGCSSLWPLSRVCAACKEVVLLEICHISLDVTEMFDMFWMEGLVRLRSKS